MGMSREEVSKIHNRIEQRTRNTDFDFYGVRMSDLTKKSLKDALSLRDAAWVDKLYNGYGMDLYCVLALLNIEMRRRGYHPRPADGHPTDLYLDEALRYAMNQFAGIWHKHVGVRAVMSPEEEAGNVEMGHWSVIPRHATAEDEDDHHEGNGISEEDHYALQVADFKAYVLHTIKEISEKVDGIVETFNGFETRLKGVEEVQPFLTALQKAARDPSSESDRD